jgi:hypothetical protein
MPQPTRPTITAFAVAALLALAPAAHSDGTVAIQFSGEKDWNVSCTLRKDNGKESTISRQGRGFSSIKSLSSRSIASGTCTASIPEGTSLKVTFTGSGSLACPFGSKDPCVTILAGDSRTFAF